MRDPFPIPAPPALLAYVKPFVVDQLGLSTLPFHVHELLLSAAFYTWIYLWLSPRVSSRLFPRSYASFSPRTRLNWDIHVVAFLQSLIICVFAFYIILRDPDRVDTTWADRIWGYSGLVGFCQAMAGGYFLWDLFVTIRHFDIFGPGMLIHALSALFVFAFGYRPIFTYFGPAFLIYEVSSPFNNIHWFLDKLSLTGSTYQWVNGIILIATFFLCRLVWGFYFTGLLIHDLWHLYTNGFIYWTPFPPADPVAAGLTIRSARAKFDRFAAGPGEKGGFDAWHGRESISIYLAGAFVLANMALNGLNVYWIGKMISTVRRRFPPPFGTKMEGVSVRELKMAGSEDRKDL